MLIAPEAPAPIAIQKMAITSSIGCKPPGARNKPTNPVKTTRDITLGFKRLIKSMIYAPSEFPAFDASIEV
tara:strand:- start:5601 stop:5813 length:213 start_codon:yes stop_codon:yes gene_type:complete